MLQRIHGHAYQKGTRRIQDLLGCQALILEAKTEYHEMGGKVMIRGSASEPQLIPAQSGPESLEHCLCRTGQSKPVQILLQPVSPL